MGEPETTSVAPGPHRGPTTLQRRLPNALTIARVAMTVAFVAVLSVYRFPDVNAWALPTALVLFVVAALTDAADGYLARRWNVVSVFGRIVDPLADKVLVLGAFIMLAGPGFFASDDFVMTDVSGVAPWMVVVILARELLVTTMRGALEGRGIDFSAAWSGKVKMIAQSVGIPLILLLVIGAEATHDNPLAEYHRHLPEMRQQALEAGQAGDMESIERYVEEAMAANQDLSDRLFEIGPERLAENGRRVERLSAVCSVVAWVITVLTAISVVPYVARALRLTKAGSDG